MNPPPTDEFTAWKEEVARRAAAYEMELREREEARKQARVHDQAVLAEQKNKVGREFWIAIARLSVSIGVAVGGGIVALRLRIPLPRFLDYGWWIWIPVAGAFCTLHRVLTDMLRVPVVISCFICFGAFGIFAGASYRQKLTSELASWSYGNPEDVIRLVRRGADINVRGEQGDTVLLRAAHWGYTDLVRFLIEHEANVQARTPDEKTALMEASHDPQLLAVLVNAGVDVRAKDNAGKTALHYVSKYEDGCSRPPLEMENDELRSTIQYLVEAGADPNASDNTGKTPLMLAVANCNPTIVKTLLEAKANPNAIDAEGNTALLIAAQKLDYSSAAMIQDTIGLLVKLGADVHHQDPSGNSALHLIAHSGGPPALKLLLRFGQQLEQRNSQGLTPLMVAASSCNYSGAEFLLLAGASIMASTRSGETAVELAAREGCVELTQLLARKAGLPASVAFQKLAALTKDKVVVFVIDAGFYTHRYSARLLPNPFAKPVGHGRIVEAFVTDYFAGKVEYFDVAADFDQFDGAKLIDAFREIYEYAITFTNTRIVVNMSWGISEYSGELEKIIRLMLDRGMILVAAAGNDGTWKCNYPAAYPGVIGVGAAERTQSGNYRLASYSNMECVAAVAPVEAEDMIRVFKEQFLYDESVDNNPAEIQALKTVGTSFAAPQVAGVIASELLANPALTSDRALALVKTRWPY